MPSAERYEPPFVMTEEITNLVIEIGEYAGRVSARNRLSDSPVLRRQNRIKTIYSSLAIEQNTLSLEQVTDVIAGKRVLAPPQDIREVKNAYEAYEHLNRLNPFDLNDLLLAHRFMMADLIEEAGCFRSGDVGVFAGTRLIHAGTPARYVPELMRQLFTWLQSSKLHPLVKSCIFHYEFEFIHPFSDGNGRTGRLWHSLILRQWKPFFEWLPIETLIQSRQSDYYRALNDANTGGQSTIFVQFMLSVIRDALAELWTTDSPRDVGDDVGDHVGDQQRSREEQCLSLLRGNPRLSASDAAALMRLSPRQAERIIAALKKSGRLSRVGAARSGHWQVND